jgi:hypothetical protein
MRRANLHSHFAVKGANMGRSAIIAALATLLLTARSGSGLTAQEALARLRAKLAVEPVTDTSLARLAGQYTSSSEELRRRVGGFLSGNDLYLFADRSYIYCEWADIEPDTIHDKGAWQVRDGFLELKTSADVTWKPKVEREYIIVHRASRPDEIVLVGAKDGLSYFEQNAGDDPELMLLIVSKVRNTPFTRSKSAKLKARLMRESWRPEYFREPTK